MKKKVPLLICVQSKNNLHSASAAHWGKLVKISVSTETAKVLHGTKVYEDREGDKEKREGLKWKLEHEWEGTELEKAESLERRVVRKRQLKSTEWLECCQPLPRSKPVGQSSGVQYTPQATRCE